MCNSSRPTSQRLIRRLALSRHSRWFSEWLVHENFLALVWLQITSTIQFVSNAGRNLVLEPCPSNLVLITACTLHSCLYNSAQFWQDSRAHTRVLAFMNLLGCECQADWMNSGHKSQTSTMTLFIQTWPPECRWTLWVINFHGPRTSASTKLIPRRKMHPGKCSGAAKTSCVFIPRLCIIPLMGLVADWQAQPEVLFKSSAFC